MGEKILITGGSGLVGKQLTELLLNQGYQVSILSRRKKENTSNISYHPWDIEKGEVEVKAILEADFIIHLVGENVAKSRWTKSQKRKILESRTLSTKLLYDVLSKNENKVKAFVSASATGFYGMQNSDEIFKEEYIAGNDFLATVCRQWEDSVDKIESLGIRTVKLRTGVVLAREGSALQKMLPPMKMGIGSAIGSGKQYMPWIHIDDLCTMYLLAINKEKLSGAYNAVVGDALTNKELSSLIAAKLEKPFFMPNVPSLLLKLIFGEMSVILTKGNQVSSEKILKAGFVFKYDTIEKALDHLLVQKVAFED